MQTFMYQDHLYREAATVPKAYRGQTFYHGTLKPGDTPEREPDSDNPWVVPVSG